MSIAAECIHAKIVPLFLPCDGRFISHNTLADHWLRIVSRIVQLVPYRDEPVSKTISLTNNEYAQKTQLVETFFLALDADCAVDTVARLPPTFG